MFKNKKGKVIGLLSSGEDKKFSMTGVKDVGWKHPGDDVVGKVGGNHIEETSRVFLLCPVGSH